MDNLRSSVTLVEEAGEILEARSICTLTKNTE
jgi:hypothetical protein